MSADIGKGGRERAIPVIPDLVAVVDEIRANVAIDEYVLPAQRFRDPPKDTERLELRFRPSLSQALRELVIRVAARAGVSISVSPHDMRHAYAEHIARNAGTRTTQHLLATQA